MVMPPLALVLPAVLLAGVPWSRVLDQPAGFYASPEAVRIGDNVLLYQRGTGGWPKNLDMAQALREDERKVLGAERSLTDSTIDNGATFTQLRYLARVFEATEQERFRAGFVRGLDYLFAAQYPNGGWPQFFPLRADYSRHVTFNDGAMIGVLNLLRDVSGDGRSFTFVDEGRRSRAREAVATGTRLVLAAQIRVEGRLTAWCAQHDEKTLEPRGARTYEHPSLSGFESVGIVEFLMSQDPATPEVVAAVEAAVAWLGEATIRGLRVERRRGPDVPGGYDVVAVSDPTAAPLWARFYEMGTNRPIFSGRDGVVKRSLEEIEQERRTGYSWLGAYAQDLLERGYPAWKHRTRGAVSP